MPYDLYSGDSLGRHTRQCGPRKPTFVGWCLKDRLKEEAGRAPPHQLAWLPCCLFAVRLSFRCSKKLTLAGIQVTWVTCAAPWVTVRRAVLPQRVNTACSLSLLVWGGRMCKCIPVAVDKAQ